MSRAISLKLPAGILLLALTGLTLIGGSIAFAATSAPWSQTDSNGAANRANLTETTLTASSVVNAKYLRSIVAKPFVDGDQDYGCADRGFVAPALTGGRVYSVAGDSLSVDDAATGANVWRKDLHPGVGAMRTVEWASLAVTNGLIIIGGQDCSSEATPPGVLYAYNASTGALVWRGAAPVGLDHFAVSGNYVVQSGSVEGAYSLNVVNATTGALVWSRETGSCSKWTIVAGNVIFSTCPTSTSPVMEADKLATGTRVWTKSGSWSIQRGDNDATTGLHAYAGSPTGGVADINPSTGAVRYNLANAGAVLAVDATRVYATCGSAKVCGYTRSTGALVWTHSIRSSTSSLGTAAAGVLYLDTGEVINASTGSLIRLLFDPTPKVASWHAIQPPQPNVLVGDGRIAVVNDDRVLDLYGLAGS